MLDWLRNILGSVTYSVGSAEDIIRRIADLQKTQSGVSVDEKKAMRFSTVWACVRLLSDTLAQLPCHVHEKDAAGNRRMISDGALAVAIGQSPDLGLTAFDFWKYQTQCLLLRGYCVSQIIRGGDTVIRLMPIMRVDKIERKPEGRYVFHYRNTAGDPVALPQEDAFFAFYAIDDDLLPMSPIKMQAEAIGLGIRAQQHGSKTLATNASPAGTLDVAGKLDKQVKKEIKEQWDAAYGPDGNGGVAVLEGGAKFAPISMSNEDAQLLQTRQFQRQEICGIYGVPPHMISDTAQAKGWSTMEQMMTEFVVLALNPLTIRLEQAIARALIPLADRNRLYVKFATNGLLRGDSAARAAFYRSGIDAGWLSPNEARRLEELNPLPGGDGISRANTAAQKGTPNE